MTTLLPARKQPRDADHACEWTEIVEPPMTQIARTHEAPQCLMAARLDADEIPEWIYRRCVATDPDVATPRVPVANRCDLDPDMDDSPTNLLAANDADLIRAALLNSGYPVHHVDCWCDVDKVTLSGFVTRYYYLQVALETTRRLAGCRHIVNRIEVLPMQARQSLVD
jgi:hypothetical protein